MTKPSRSRSNGRLAVSGRQRPHRDEPAHAERAQRSLGAARDGRVKIAAPDHSIRLTHRMASRRARAGGRQVGATRAVANRDMAGRKIADQLRNEKRGDPFEAALEENKMVLLDRDKPADTDANQHADMVGIVLVDLEPRLAHR